MQAGLKNIPCSKKYALISNNKNAKDMFAICLNRVLIILKKL